MNKSIALLIIFYPMIASSVLAQTPTLTTAEQNESTPARKPILIPSKQIEKIQELKERLATRVAQLRLSKKKVLIGKINSLDKPTLTLTALDGPRKIETDEDTTITLLTDSKTRAITFPDLKKGQSIIVWGTYIQEGDTLTAKAIWVKEPPLGLLGTIANVDIKGGTVTLQTLKTNQSYLLDVEVFTKINTLDKDNKIAKFGFSKIKTGNRAYIYATPSSKKDAAPYTAYRILLLPNPPITVITPEGVSPTSIPTTTPTKKLTPSLKLDATITP